MTPLGRAARIEALRAHPAPDAAAAAELRLLEAGRLDIRRTLAAIRTAAERRACLSYAAVAEASGLSWREARRRMDPHLFGLCRWALERGWPLLSAVVVNQALVASGRMEGRTLIGFTAAARRLGVVVGADPAVFLRREQEAVFAWARRESGRDLYA